MGTFNWNSSLIKVPGTVLGAYVKMPLEPQCSFTHSSMYRLVHLLLIQYVIEFKIYVQMNSGVETALSYA